MARVHSCIAPVRLRRGDLIGIVAPSSPERHVGRAARGAAYLESLGFRVTMGAHVDRRDGYLAGSDAERAADVNTMFADPRVKAIMCTRGGYGAARILPLLDWPMIRRNPKIFVGFSDGTALNLALLAQARLITFTGALPGVDLWKDDIDTFTESHFRAMLTTSGASAKSMKCEMRRGDVAEGILVGGNLALTASLVGTPYFPTVPNAVWVLEDVTEEPYRIDRMLSQLLIAGVFADAAGIVFGQFAHCDPVTLPSPSVDRVIDALRSQVTCPVATNLQYGHVASKLTLPIGARVRCARGRLTIVESPTAPRDQRS